MNPQSGPGISWWGGPAKVLVILFGPLILIWIAMLIDKSDLFQQVINPQKYWQTRVAALEQKIYETKSFIADWNNNADDDLSVNYEEIVRKLIIEGKEPEEAKRIASEMVRRINEADKSVTHAISKIRPELLRNAYDSLDNYKMELQKARRELSRYQR